MITPEQRAEARRLFYADHHTVNAIATAMGLHHEAIENAIGIKSFNAKQAALRKSQLDPYIPIIKETLDRVPSVRAPRMTEVIKARGFVGSVHIVRRLLRQLRGNRAEEAYVRLSKIAGEEAQCDWGHFGTIQIGKAVRKLSCFVMVLSYSRHIYAAFTLDQTLESFLRQHVLAFRWFGGVPRSVLYDCLKAAVLERVGDAIRFNPALLELAGHYHFRPAPCRPRMPRHKGRVERTISYLRTGFFPARHFKDLADANRQLTAWLNDVANARSWPQDRSRRVDETFIEDRQRLLSLPEHDADCWHTRPVRSDKTAYVRFDLNDYSIPPEYCRRPLTLMASDTVLRLLDGGQVVADHVRSYDKGQQVECGSHTEAIIKHRKEALPQRRRESLMALIPESKRLLEMLADRGEGLVRHLRRLYDLVHEYGATAVAEAIKEAIERNTPRSESVAHLLAKKHQDQRKAPPQLHIDLPDRPGVRDLVIRHHNLEQYDTHIARPQPQQENPQND